MVPYNPHYLSELMADRERQIKKVATINQARQAIKAQAPVKRQASMSLASMRARRLKNA